MVNVIYVLFWLNVVEMAQRVRSRTESVWFVNNVNLLVL
jgi:hypothetical protein